MLPWLSTHSSFLSVERWWGPNQHTIVASSSLKSISFQTFSYVLSSTEQQKGLKRSSLRTATKDKLLSLGTRLSLQLTFIVTILKEKYTCTNENSTVAKQPSGIPRLSYKEFIGGQRPSFERLVVHDISCISLTAINYTVCHGTPEGTFDFDGVDSPTTAHGVSAVPKSEQADVLTTQTGSISNS